MLSSDIVHSSPTPQVILRFESTPSGETFLARRFVTYPFFLTAPFRLDRTPAGMVTTILQSVSGGVYEREQLALSLTAEEMHKLIVRPKVRRLFIRWPLKEQLAN